MNHVLMLGCDLTAHTVHVCVKHRTLDCKEEKGGKPDSKEMLVENTRMITKNKRTSLAIN